MKRRELIALVGGAVVAWPLSVRGQQKTMPVIGVLLYGTTLANQEHPLIAGLRDVGLVEGRTASILVREAEGRTERLPCSPPSW